MASPFDEIFKDVDEEEQQKTTSPFDNIFKDEEIRPEVENIRARKLGLLEPEQEQMRPELEQIRQRKMQPTPAFNLEDVKKRTKSKEGYASMLPKKGETKNSMIGNTQYSTYYDSVGKLTAGIGHLLTPKELRDYKSGKTKEYWDNLSKDEAEKIFQQDFNSHKKEIDAVLKANGIDKNKIPDNAYKALLDMGFNMGSAGLGSFKNTLRYVKEGKYEEAAKGILNSKYAKQVPSRAQENADLMRTVGKINLKEDVAEQPRKISSKPLTAVYNSELFGEGGAKSDGMSGDKAFIYSMADGATFGFAEELVAAGKATIDEIKEAWGDAPEASKSAFLDKYIRYRDEGEDYMARLKQEYPKAAFLGELLGGLAVPGLGAAKAAKTSLSAAMKVGAATGAVYGFGESKEGILGEVDRYKAVKDTLIGAGFGAMGGAAGRGITKWLASRKANAPIDFLDEVGEDLHKSYVRDFKSQLPDIKKKGKLMADAFDSADDAISKELAGERDEFNWWLYKNHSDKVKKPLSPEEKFRLKDQAEQFAMQEDMGGFDEGFFQTTYNKLVKDAQTPTIEEMQDAVRDSIRKRGIDVEDAYKVFREEKLFKERYIDAAVDELGLISGIRGNELKPVIWDKFTDLNVFANQTDRVSRFTDLRSVINDVAQGHIAFQADSAYFTGKLSKLMKETKKLNLDNKKLARLIEGKDSIKNAEQELIVDKWQEFTTELFDYGAEKGIFTPDKFRANYFHHTTLEPTEVVRVLRRTLGKGTDNVLNSRKRDFVQLRKVIRSRLELKPKTKITEDHVKQFAIQLENPDAARKLAAKSEVGAAFEREGAVVDLIREFDPGKAFGSYINKLTRTPNMSGPLMKLKREIGILQQLGLNRRAEYWNTYLDNMHGVKHSTANAIEDGINKFKLALTKDADYLGEQLSLPRKMAYRAPDVISWLGGVAYNNLLGFHPYAAIRNMGQPHFLTARELTATGGKGGSAFYHKMAAEAQFQTALDFAKKSARGKGNIFKALDDMTEEMVKLRKAPADFVGEVEPMMREELGKVSGLTKDAVDMFGKIGMYFYGKSDVINRIVTDKMAQKTAKAAIAKNPIAMASIKKIGGKLGAKMENAMADGNVDELHNLLSHHLIGQTQFHYGAHGAAEFVREWGRIVGMFTKWPIAVTSDIADLVQRKEMRQLGAKYLSPVLTLMAGQQALNQVIDERDARRRALLGKNLVDMAPLWSINVSSPPAISTVLSTIQATKKLAQKPGDYKGYMEDFEQTVRPWVPVWGHISTQLERYKGTK